MSIEADDEEIREFLSAFPEEAAFALADLSPEYRPFARFDVAKSSIGVEAVSLVYSRPEFTTLLLFGAADAVYQVLKDNQNLPRIAMSSFRDGHKESLKDYFHLRDLTPVTRMAVTANTFLPREGPEVRRLTRDDFPQIEKLISLETNPYRAFNADQLNHGIFYGCFRDSGYLLAVGGTHVFAPEQDVAAIGNVVTHPNHRRQGMASAIASAVVGQALDSCGTVVLNVFSNNEPAISLYKTLGFRVHMHLTNANLTLHA